MITESRQLSTNVLIGTSQKAMFLSTTKIGTRYLEKYLAPTVSFFEVDNQLKISIKEDEVLTTGQKDIIDDWNLIFSKKSKKDIIVCYRNPYNRLLSSVIQDVVVNIASPFFNPFLEEVFFSKGYTQEQMRVFYNQLNQVVKLEDASIDINDIIKNKPEFGEMIQYVIKLYLRYYLNNPTYNFHHNTIYLPFVVSLFLNGDVDTNKIKLINIDEKSEVLQQTLKDYDITITNSVKETRKVTYSNKSKINSLLPDIISELGGSSVIEHRLSQEIIAYNQLELIRNGK